MNAVYFCCYYGYYKNQSKKHLSGVSLERKNKHNLEMFPLFYVSISWEVMGLLLPLTNDIHLSTRLYWHKGNMKTFHKGYQGYNKYRGR